MAITARGARTREAFRAAARQVIGDRGFLRTTVGEIALAAGRSPASFYNYYDSKEELLAELAEEFREDAATRARPAFRSGADARKRLRDTAAAYWHSYKEHLAELVGVFQVAMVDEAFAERWREIRLGGIETIRDGIERAQAAGYCPDVDPALTAAALGSMFEHFCFVSLAQGGAFAGRGVDDDAAIDTIASIWYHAVYWRRS